MKVSINSTACIVLLAAASFSVATPQKAEAKQWNMCNWEEIPRGVMKRIQKRGDYPDILKRMNDHCPDAALLLMNPSTGSSSDFVMKSLDGLNQGEEDEVAGLSTRDDADESDVAQGETSSGPSGASDGEQSSDSSSASDGGATESGGSSSGGSASDGGGSSDGDGSGGGDSSDGGGSSGSDSSSGDGASDGGSSSDGGGSRGGGSRGNNGGGNGSEGGSPGKGGGANNDE